MQLKFTVCLFFSGCIFCSAQNTFSLGAKGGYGTSAFPMNALLHTPSLTEPAKAGATISAGIIGRYFIADQFGIESGTWINHYSFYRQADFRKRDQYWKNSAESEILNFQIPVIFNYKVKPGRHPFHYVIFGAGTSIDCFSTSGLSARENAIRPYALQNLIGAIRIGREKMRGKIEAGFEFQYSLKYYTFSNINYIPFDNVVTSKLNMISFVVNYFFLNKQRGNADVLTKI